MAFASSVPSSSLVTTLVNNVAAVRTHELQKSYKGGVKALSGLSLSIQAGEIFAVLGPNGAGKTTWISIVCGLVRPTAGWAEVMGFDVVKSAIAARKNVGLVPQEMNFDPFFTPREVLAFQMGYYGQVPDPDRIAEVLAALDLTSKADTNTRALSGGMKRRLLIGKALVHRPRVVFLDEPTAGVDVGLRRDLWNYVRQLRAEGTTIVLTTHYLEEAEALADRVAVIDKGSLICLDTPSRLMGRFGQKQIRATLAEPLGPPGAPEIPESLRDFSPTLDFAGRVITCPVTEAQLPVLLARLADLRPRVVDVDTSNPSLEQVFLKLTETGRRGSP